ncbi:hypothetical protein [Vibrio penaeicida]|uniref:Lipoprotein n=1 Tax=Vibrio penaeicida TaxID=104609 RepID=A0AAV5NTF6_9VIBR|nr:hypothetical protein [Vibrio penaeicida]GLQ73900.1 hypothetical protein GCM10007932_32600 [Vibrio penaeicida]
MKSIISLVFIAFLLNGCQLTRVEGEVDDVEIKVGTKEQPKSEQPEGKFCPPGQAKKGRC